MNCGPVLDHQAYNDAVLELSQALNVHPSRLLRESDDLFSLEPRARVPSCRSPHWVIFDESVPGTVLSTSGGAVPSL